MHDWQVWSHRADKPGVSGNGITQRETVKRKRLWLFKQCRRIFFFYPNETHGSPVGYSAALSVVWLLLLCACSETLMCEDFGTFSWISKIKEPLCGSARLWQQQRPKYAKAKALLWASCDNEVLSVSVSFAIHLQHKCVQCVFLQGLQWFVVSFICDMSYVLSPTLNLSLREWKCYEWSNLRSWSCRFHLQPSDCI